MHRLGLSARLTGVSRSSLNLSVTASIRPASSTTTTSTTRGATTATSATHNLTVRRPAGVSLSSLTGAARQHYHHHRAAMVPTSPSLLNLSSSLASSSPSCSGNSNGSSSRTVEWSCLCDSGSSSSLSASTLIAQQRRGVRLNNKDDSSSSSSSGGSESSNQDKESAAGAGDEKASGSSSSSSSGSSGKAGGGAGASTKKTSGGGGISGHIQGLKNDIKDFPDIYNSVNFIHFLIFTIFCLCSTGSNVEEEWWTNTWGIDAAFAPWAWPLHSFLTNNFLSMTLAMLLLHSMCHSVMPFIGPNGLLLYCGIISVASGFLIWAGDYAAHYTSEKQFGPWDVVAGLFVMQALHQGFMPWQILNAFHGWVKYACYVGMICICYFDWQPTLAGTGVGLALCKLHPKFNRVKVGKM